MFGHMKAQPILTLDVCSTEHAVEALQEATDYAEPVRWIEFPSSVLLLLVVKGQPDSGALYVLDRMSGTWLWIDFEEQFGGYGASDFDLLLHEYDFLRLVELPGLLRAKQGWLLEPGRPAEMAVPSK